MIALYDKAGRMVDLIASPKEMEAGKMNAVSVSLPYDPAEGYTAKAFLWHGETFAPLTNAVTAK